ncbi:MAG TPA: glycoside hydrolase family 38 C-terminal domain-containing protein [Phycisphaerae bacterium]|nr:glycoside hydrolase family 38 C-terminal domain-containing protein [Phycisphaerae bacterium]
MSAPKRIGHYVSSAHWDREWYEPFQDYRFRLVNMLDDLLDRMEREPEFRYFQSDGQSILWEDYLEIRPEREEQVRRLAEQDRLRIGPWYVLTDELVVSGESLVRNLQRGLRIAGSFGQPSRIGFVSDLFGHTSQLPQILRGFNIDNAFLWRGVNEETHGAIFRWRSPDGSEVIAYRFSPIFGYGLYAEKVRTISQPDKPVDMDSALAGLREVIDIETGRCPTRAFLVFDGADHQEIEPITVELLRKANKRFKDVELIHSHLDGFIEDVREERDRIEKVFTGELREPGLLGDDGWLVAGVLSSRIHLKQANARCENELTRWAEPFSVFAEGLGLPCPAAFLDRAWKYLLRNHPHDSICTCSIDQVHKDMTYRFDQSLMIARHISRDALRHITHQVKMPEMGELDFAVVVFNPNADPIDGPADLTLRFPRDIDAVYQEFFGYEPKIGFRLSDPDGTELPYQYVNQRRDVSGFRRRLRKLPFGERRHEVDVTVPLRIPAYGYTRIVCRPTKEPTRYLGSMLVDDHTIENEHLRVSVASNGTLTIIDKRNGQTYTNLLTLEDAADIADGWHRGIAVNDEMFTSAACAADVAVTADGKFKATLRIRLAMNVPERFQFDAMCRSGRCEPMVVVHHVTLRRGCDRIEVRTEVDNTARDHRLRALFPSGAKAETYLADAPFDVVERSIALRADNDRCKELELETKPQQSFTAVFDDRRGLAVVSTGLPESAVRDLPDRPIALTLLRSFAKTPFTGHSEDGGQIQGRHVFDYWLVPLTGRPDTARLCRLGQQLAGGVRAVQVEHQDWARPGLAGFEPGNLPPSHSFLDVDPNGAVVTAIHHSGHGETATVRLFNPTDKPLELAVRLRGSQSAARTNLEGRVLDPQPIDSRQRAKLQIEPKQIVTIRFSKGM